jgi:hypothetical protein
MEPEILAEYEIDWKKCLNGKVQLFSDSTYTQKCENKEETGTWFFKSVIDSVLCLRRDETITTTTNVTRNYFVQNDFLHALELIEVIEEFEWILGKRGPSWTLSSSLKSEETNLISENATQIISSIDSSAWNYVYKGDNGNFCLTLSGYYFMENQPGMSAGGSEYISRAFLALEKNDRKTNSDTK